MHSGEKKKQQILICSFDKNEDKTNGLFHTQYEHANYYSKVVHVHKGIWKGTVKEWVIVQFFSYIMARTSCIQRDDDVSALH
jgi:hypothetical protein